MWLGPLNGNRLLLFWMNWSHQIVTFHSVCGILDIKNLLSWILIEKTTLNDRGVLVYLFLGIWILIYLLLVDWLLPWVVIGDLLGVIPNAKVTTDCVYRFFRDTENIFCCFKQSLVDFCSFLSWHSFSCIWLSGVWKILPPRIDYLSLGLAVSIFRVRQNLTI